MISPVNSDIYNKYIYKHRNKKTLGNITYDEFNHTVNNIETKSQKRMLIVTGSVLLSILAFYIAMRTGTMSKAINKFSNWVEKSNSSFANYLKQKVKSTKKIKINFEQGANAHFHNIGTKNNKISGAHELQETLKTLIEENGSITSIKTDLADNGILDIFYELNGKVSKEPKTVYIKKELDSEAMNMLNKLCKDNNKKLVSAKKVLLNGKYKICDENIEDIARQALNDGFIVQTSKTQKAIANFSKKLSEQIRQKVSADSNIDIITSKIANLKEEINNLETLGQNVSEQKQILNSLNKRLSNLKKTSKGCAQKISDLESKLLETKRQARVLGKRNGILFSGYGEFDNNGVFQVRSFFPVTHGSIDHKELMELYARESKFSLSKLPLIAGLKGKMIDSIFGNIFKNHKTQIVNTALGGTAIGATTITTITEYNEFNNLLILNKQRQAVALSQLI